MLDFYIYYILIGFHLNLIVSLFIFYRADMEGGYVALPHPVIFFITIFTWPYTLFGLISNLFSKDEDDE